MRRTPWNLKNPKYQNLDGSLKDGYTYHPVNEGYEKVGAVKTQERKGAGKDGTDWQITGEKAIYKDGPSPKSKTEVVYVDRPVPEAEAPPAPVQLSDQAAEANAYTAAYNKIMLPRQGDYVIKNDQSVAQDFKNMYEANLTNELREKVPGSLEAKAEDIKQKDVYSLNLGSGLSLV